MAGEYRLLSYRGQDGVARAGILVGERVYPAAKLLAGIAGIDVSSVLGLLQSWDVVHPRLAASAGAVSGAAGNPLAETELLAPILYPGAVFCAGANYWDHAQEMFARQHPGKEMPRVRAKDPWFFIKTGAHSIVGPGAQCRLPAIAKNIDWEAELGVVIGRTTRNISVERALEAVAGYLIVNDLSARDLGRVADREGSAFQYDWLGQKCFDDAAPMGPWITPAAYVPDPNDLTIKLWVSGVLKQDSSSAKMIHSIAEQIACLSRHLTLRPGDVIATGTAAGVGAGRGEFLKPGDEVRIEIAGCGVLVNRMVAE